MKKVLKVLMYLVLVYVVVVVTYGTIKKVKESIKEKEKLKKQSPYTDRISDKYPESTINIVEILEKIQKKVKREEKVDLEDGKYRINFYDDKNRLVYTILEENRVEKSVSSGVKWGKIVVYKAKFPKEEGTLYNDSGKIEAKILINQKYMSFYELNKSEDINNRVSFYHKRMLGEGRAVKYEYSLDNNYKTVEHEIDNQFNRNYKKIEKEYKNEKLVKEYILIDREGGIDDASSKILVEITKEYDKDEKLIKKFVLRKNKHNTIRSETNFDLIKGEIITKYYDGEKVFATVTETLIGKDRAIVKRERVGDEFVIWDFHKFEDKYDKHDVYVVHKETGEVDCAMLECLGVRGGFSYGISTNGISKEEFITDYFFRDNKDGIYENNTQSYEINLQNDLGFCSKIESLKDEKIEVYENISELRNDDILYYKKINTRETILTKYYGKKEGDFYKQDIQKIKEKNNNFKNIKVIEEEFRSGY